MREIEDEERQGEVDERGNMNDDKRKRKKEKR